MKFLSKLNLKKYRGKICLLRVDLNIETPAEAAHSLRISAVVPTVALLRKHGVTVVLLSHRGRPVTDRKQKTINKKLSLKLLVLVLSRKFHERVTFIPHFRFAEIERTVHGGSSGIFLLENLRFLPGEERGDRQLANKLKWLGDFYVNDAFAVSHRADTTVAALPRLLPRYAGLSLEEELTRLGGVMGRPQRPFTLIIGGAKIADKVGVLSTLGKKADTVLVAGGPASTFFAAQGLPVGDSLVDAAAVPFVAQWLKNPRLRLPVDVKLSGRKIWDIGPQTLAEWREVIRKSRMIVWNGPPGFFEKHGFERGTAGLWRAVLGNQRSRTVVGGGETAASIALARGVRVPRNVFLSTGGGAMLEFLSGKKLPGIEALK